MVNELNLLQIILGIDTWLEWMRDPGGYGGPVVHWWDDCLHYTGVGLDWRYEGVIIGYLNLWRATGDKQWLDKAQRAGDDLVTGQLPSGNYRNSCFELNPNTGGTPHEAAADLGLLEFAAELKAIGDCSWVRYFETAETNLQLFYLGQLWNGKLQNFNDAPIVYSFVPNKSATLVQALLAYVTLSGEESILEEYILPSLDKILMFQVKEGDLVGGICQNMLHGKIVKSCFPYYVARCIPALLLGYQVFACQKYLAAALAAGSFIIAHRYPDGSFPQVVYHHGRVNRYPQWIAPAADILLALDQLTRFGFEYDRQPTFDWILDGELPGGGFRTGVGFGKARSPKQKNDPRDHIACVGWVDKVFRYLSAQLIQV